MHKRSLRQPANGVGRALLILGLVGFATLVAYAADGPFAGKWKGELQNTPAFAGRAGVPASAPAGGEAPAPSAAPAASPGGGGFGGGGRGGGGRGGGFPPGGAFGGRGGPQKVTLNLKQSKDDKLSGNITIGDANPDDVKEGKVTGETISFKAGRAPQPIYEYYGELKGGELVLTRNSPEGRGRPVQIILKK